MACGQGVPPAKWAHSRPPGTVRRPIPPLLACLTLLLQATPVLAGSAAVSSAAGSLDLAQVETFMLQPGSNVGPGTRIIPTNCVTAPDGSVTCDTKIENPPGDTPAQPQFQPFRN